MAPITNSQLLSEITRIKERLEKVEHAVDGRNGGTVATLIKDVREMNQRLQGVEKTIGAVRMAFITIGSILGPVVSIAGLVIQHYWH